MIKTEYKCPKCGEKEISMITQDISDSGLGIITGCECHICEHKFRLIYVCSAYMNGWEDES